MGTNGTLGQLVRLSFLIGLGAQGGSWTTATTRSDLGQRRALPGGATGSGEIDRDRLAASVVARSGRSPRSTRRPSGARQLRARGQPGDARLDHRPAGAVDPDPRVSWPWSTPSPGRAAAGSGRRLVPLASAACSLVASMLWQRCWHSTGGTPEPPPAPPAPTTTPSTAPPLGVLLGLAAVVVLLMWAGRFLMARSRPVWRGPLGARRGRGGLPDHVRDRPGAGSSTPTRAWC